MYKILRYLFSYLLNKFIYRIYFVYSELDESKFFVLDDMFTKSVVFDQTSSKYYCEHNCFSQIFYNKLYISKSMIILYIGGFSRFNTYVLPFNHRKSKDELLTMCKYSVRLSENIFDNSNNNKLNIIKDISVLQSHIVKYADREVILRMIVIEGDPGNGRMTLLKDFNSKVLIYDEKKGSEYFFRTKIVPITNSLGTYENTTFFIIKNKGTTLPDRVSRYVIKTLYLEGPDEVSFSMINKYFKTNVDLSDCKTYKEAIYKASKSRCN